MGIGIRSLRSVRSLRSLRYIRSLRSLRKRFKGYRMIANMDAGWSGDQPYQGNPNY